MDEKLIRIIEMLKVGKNMINGLNVTIGFDGFIDEITRVVKNREDAEQYSFFKTIAEFSAHTSNAAGKSADMEIITEDIKLGGNAPIMANALASFGVNTTCIGAMGYPELKDVFDSMSTRCCLMSICEPGYTHAFEFEDGKLMFANVKPLEELTWDRVKKLVGLDTIINMFKNSSLIALVNWSIAYNAVTVWEGIKEEVLPQLCPDINSKIKVFFDLADPAKRTREDILSVLKLISSYSKYCDVTLGLNENEALRIYGALNNNTGCCGYALEEIALCIFKYTTIDTLLIHPVDSCIAVTGDSVVKEKGKVIQSPKITTGGGDNFNAGYCLGHLLGFDIGDSIIIGMAASGSYVKNGYSPSIDELTDYLEEWSKET